MLVSARLRVATLFVAGALSSLSFAATPAPNCPPPPVAPEPAKIAELARQAVDRGFLWKIEKEGRTSYLFGSIHVNSLEWMIPGRETLTAVKNSDLIAVEIDPLDPEVAKTLAAPESVGVKPKILKPELRARLDALLTASCVPPEAVAKWPAFMQFAAATVFDARSLGLEAAYGTEIFLSGLAQGLKKPIISLESAELQLRALRDDGDTEAMLTTGLDQAGNGKARRMLTRLHKAWGESNFAEMESMAQWCECMDSAEERRLLARLNDDRNPALAAGIDKQHQQGKRVFAAVGTLHMFGDKGLPKLLKEMGYRVERVTAVAAPRAPKP